MEPPVFRTSFNRGLMRSRPYRDPYEKAEAEDDNSSTSVVSGWNLDDNMRKIIYDDETSNLEVCALFIGSCSVTKIQCERI